MFDQDQTLTSPISALVAHRFCMLGLTVLWHPDLSRVGEQAWGPDGVGDMPVQRYAPLFCKAGALNGEPLGVQAISRAELRLRRHADDTVSLIPPPSRMRIELDGVAVEGEVTLPRERLERGVVISLGGVVLLCLHWITALPRANALGDLIGVSSQMVRVRDQIRQVAATDLPTLLLAESGCGKELVADAIHRTSRRNAAPFVAVNMAALSDTMAVAELFGALKGAYTGSQMARLGVFAEASDGTLFMDEIGDTPPSVQPMLLRVLETGEYRPLGANRNEHTPARLIAATDRPLGPDKFNQPLLRRLEAFVIRIAPLRERREDIGVLITHLLPEPKAELAARLPYSLVAALCQHDWPGNVRQLGHVIRRAVLQLNEGEALDAAVLLQTGGAPMAVREPQGGMPSTRGVAVSPRQPPSALTDEQVIEALDRNAWCIQWTARALAISRPSLYALIKRNRSIRQPEDIPEAELRAAFAAQDQRVDDCAAQLRTPREALRRHLDASGLLA